jgi:hypothetical protein
VCRLACLAVFISWCELEYGVAVCLGDEILYRGVLGRLEIPPGGWGDADVSLEDGRCFLGSDLPDGVLAGVTAAGQGHLSGRAGVVHPGHRPVGGDQPASPVVLDWDHGVGARLSGLRLTTATGCGTPLSGQACPESARPTSAPRATQILSEPGGVRLVAEQAWIRS